MAHDNPLKRERVFELLKGALKVEASMEDMFNSLMQDDPTREECREMISEILKQYVHSDDKEYKYIMGYVELVV